MLNNTTDSVFTKYYKDQLNIRQTHDHECKCMSFWSDCNLFPRCIWLEDAFVRGYFWYEE